MGLWMRTHSSKYTPNSSHMEVKWENGCSMFLCLCVCMSLHWLVISSSPADASTYAHFLFNAFDSAHTGSIKFEVCSHLSLLFVWVHPYLFIMLSFPPSGLCDSPVHPVEGLHYREATVDLQPLWHQQRWLHQQRGDSDSQRSLGSLN